MRWKSEEKFVLSLERSWADPSAWKINRTRVMKGPKGTSESELVGVLCVYVDDLMITAPWEVNSAMLEGIAKIWAISKPEHLLPNAEGTARFCGVHIVRKPELGIVLHQGPYVKELLRRFQMQDCKPSPTTGDSESTTELKK
jgi:hypothetical protein